MANWFEDITGGMAYGADLVNAVQRNKAAKMAEQVAQQHILGPMQQKLGLKLEEKTGLGGLLWNLGIGDPPQLIKTDATQAAERDATGGPVAPTPTAADLAAAAGAGDGAAVPAGSGTPAGGAASGLGLGASVPSPARSMALAGLSAMSGGGKGSRAAAPTLQAIPKPSIDLVKPTALPSLGAVSAGGGGPVPAAENSRLLALLAQRRQAAGLA